jgi:hypothetical protein
MDWGAISEVVVDRWIPASIKPIEPGVYRVLAKNRDGTEHQRFAKWTGVCWTNWALTAHKAKACEWPGGPCAGYRWKPL